MLYILKTNPLTFGFCENKIVISVNFEFTSIRI